MAGGDVFAISRIVNAVSVAGRCRVVISARSRFASRFSKGQIMAQLHRSSPSVVSAGLMLDRVGELSRETAVMSLDGLIAAGANDGAGFAPATATAASIATSLSQASAASMMALIED